MHPPSTEIIYCISSGQVLLWVSYKGRRETFKVWCVSKGIYPIGTMALQLSYFLGFSLFQHTWPVLWVLKGITIRQQLQGLSGLLQTLTLVRSYSFSPKSLLLYSLRMTHFSWNLSVLYASSSSPFETSERPLGPSSTTFLSPCTVLVDMYRTNVNVFLDCTYIYFLVIGHSSAILTPQEALVLM